VEGFAAASGGTKVPWGGCENEFSGSMSTAVLKS